MIGLSRRVYERLLAAYPERFRELYGEEMADLFEDECRDQLENGSRFRLLLIWLKALVDLAVSAALERTRVSTGTSMVRWSGFLTAVGGLLGITSTLFTIWLLPLRFEWVYLANIMQAVAVLFLAAGPIGIVTLIVGRERSGNHRLRRLRTPSRTLSWTQKFAVAGFLLAVLTVVACVGIFATTLLSEFFSTGNVLLMTFWPLGTLGLFSAMILLSIVVWRSNSLGRWRVLLAAAGAITILTPFAGAGLIYLIGPLGIFSTLGPEIVNWLAWILIGLILARCGNENVQFDTSISR